MDGRAARAPFCIRTQPKLKPYILSRCAKVDGCGLLQASMAGCRVPPPPQPQAPCFCTASARRLHGGSMHGSDAWPPPASSSPQPPTCLSGRAGP